MVCQTKAHSWYFACSRICSILPSYIHLPNNWAHSLCMIVLLLNVPFVAFYTRRRTAQQNVIIITVYYKINTKWRSRKKKSKQTKDWFGRLNSVWLTLWPTATDNEHNLVIHVIWFWTCTMRCDTMIARLRSRHRASFRNCWPLIWVEQHRWPAEL